MTFGDAAADQYRTLYFSRPGPMLMAAALSIVAELNGDEVDHAAYAAHTLEHRYRVGGRPDCEHDRLWHRALLTNPGFALEVGSRLGLDNVKLYRLGVRWRQEFPFQFEDIAGLFRSGEQLVAAGEWAIARTSPVASDVGSWSQPEKVTGFLTNTSPEGLARVGPTTPLDLVDGAGDSR